MKPLIGSTKELKTVLNFDGNIVRVLADTFPRLAGGFRQIDPYEYKSEEKAIPATFKPTR